MLINRHVGSIVPGNHAKTSVGGKLLIDLLNDGNYVQINVLDEVTSGGPFTRYDVGDPNNDAKKSLLDVVIASKALVPYIQKLYIDSKLKWTPSKNFNGVLKYPDHYALHLVIDNIPIRKSNYVPEKKHTIWNTKNREGWIKYKRSTDGNNKMLLKAAEMQCDDPDTIYRVVNKELTKIKFTCFGKVKVSTKSKEQKRLESLISEKKKIEAKGENKKLEM